MKQILLATLIACSGCAWGQYHVKVIPNPRNGGAVGPQWVNNYVVSYTTDNWSHSYELYSQVTYYGYDRDGKVYNSSYYEVRSFNSQLDAVSFASKFTNINKVRRYDAEQVAKHNKLKEEWDKETGKMNFKDPPVKKAKEISVF